MKVIVELDLDFMLLRKQKLWLLAHEQDSTYASGLVSLLDSVQDQSVGQGVAEKTVFGTAAADPDCAE